jgi:hypothetical protein
MKAAQFLGGLVLGALIGWLIRGLIIPPPAPAPPPRAGEDMSPAPPPPAAPAPAGSEAIPGAASPAEPPPPSPRDLLTRVRAAIREGDEGAFGTALRLLGRSEGEEAERALLALVEDPSVPSPLRGGPFLRGLARSTLPGIAAAARGRFEANLAAGEDSWVAADGWVDLVARHGDDADLVWLAGRNESFQIVDQARRAIFSSPSEAARRAARGLVESTRADIRGQIPDYLRWDLEEGFAIAERALRYVGPDAHGSSGPDLSDLFRAWGGGEPDGGIPELRAFLLGLREPMHRVAAVYAVQALAKRGSDTAAFGELLLEPTLVLERREPVEGLLSARSALGYNPVAWSERAAAALDAAGFAKEARKLRAGLSSPWRKD